LEERQDFAVSHFQEILDSLLLGVASSMSAAKRYRLRCLQVRIYQKLPSVQDQVSGGNTKDLKLGAIPLKINVLGGTPKI